MSASCNGWQRRRQTAAPASKTIRPSIRRGSAALLRNTRGGVQHHQPAPIPLFIHVGREGHEAHGFAVFELALHTLDSYNPPHVLREMDVRLFHRHRNLGEAIE